jgi:dihydrofolate synthase/folylpolyglutamate synthase
MYRLRRFGIRPGLDTVSHLLDRLGNPQNHFPIIHIAGTNGKGSIASTLAAILESCGLKTGLYTSPHLVHFNERICIHLQPITDQAVFNACQAVKQAGQSIGNVTFFEYTTAMAFYEFKRRQVDCAVIETGMGGRLDATNVVHPLLSIISNVSLEHQQYLGFTLTEIAAEKGGIIKTKTPVITGVQQPEAVTVLQQLAQDRKAPFYRLNEHFKVERVENGFFHYEGLSHHWQKLRTGLCGNYQTDNAALVLAACEQLMPFLQSFCKRNDIRFFSECLQPVLQAHRWPGRLEWIDTKPPILLDGAHNLHAAIELGHFLSEQSDQKKITLITGILDDKPYEAMLRCWLPLCHRVIFTRAQSDRSVPPEILHECARPLIDDITVILTVARAIEYAVETVLPEDLICIAGSLYVVGEAKSALNANPDLSARKY